MKSSTIDGVKIQVKDIQPRYVVAIVLIELS